MQFLPVRKDWQRRTTVVFGLLWTGCRLEHVQFGLVSGHLNTYFVASSVAMVLQPRTCPRFCPTCQSSGCEDLIHTNIFTLLCRLRWTVKRADPCKTLFIYSGVRIYIFIYIYIYMAQSPSLVVYMDPGKENIFGCQCHRTSETTVTPSGFFRVLSFSPRRGPIWTSGGPLRSIPTDRSHGHGWIGELSEVCWVHLDCHVWIGLGELEDPVMIQVIRWFVGFRV